MFDAFLPVTLPEELRYSGTYIIAPPGRGRRRS